MHAPVKVLPHEKVAPPFSNKPPFLHRIWPPAVLIFGLLLTLAWFAFLTYAVARIALKAF
jgi:hypothetical protein